MLHHRHGPTLNQCVLVLALILAVCGVTACGSKAAPAPQRETAEPGMTASQPPASEPLPTRTPPPTITPVPAPAGGQLDLSAGIPAEPFQYEVKLTPVGPADTAATAVRGVYRAGDWQQTAGASGAAVTSGGAVQASIVAGGVAFTRPAGQPGWTRWPAPGFEDAYGLTSPFTPLRLHALALNAARGELALTTGAPEATFRQTITYTAEAVASLLNAGAARLRANGGDNLDSQIAPMAVSQTVTFWTGESGRLYRAEAVLRTRDDVGQTSAWLAVTWRFWDYGDAQIKITAPTGAIEGQTALAGAGNGPQGGAQSGAESGNNAQAAPANGTPPAASAANLTVRVFASPRVSATDFAVTVYRAGDTQQPLAWHDDTDSTGGAAHFALPPGRYDVRVQSAYAEDWLRGVEIAEGAPGLTRDVTFDFGALQLAVTRGGAAPAVTLLTYPAGDRANWVDERADNPANIPLRAGVYDVEIGHDNPPISTTVKGVTIKAGEIMSRTVVVK
jgi:hypothetical protein